MNKKFSTLMAGFLLTSAFSSAQISLSVDQLKKVEDDKTIQAGGTFLSLKVQTMTLMQTTRFLLQH